jgi:hypothetical protein
MPPDAARWWMSRPAKPCRSPRAARALRPFSISFVVLALTLGALASTSRAETAIPAQALADGGAFLPYAPAPAQPSGLCVVDTGVNVNPDTEGVVVDRTAIDGGSGDDVSPTAHGTVLAMMAAAPANGWGMVGTAPRAVQIVSVRIVEPGKTTFPFSSYAAGITICLQLRHKYDIHAVNLSLGSSEAPSAQGYEAVGNAVQEATDYGVAVVAAAGNDDGGAVQYPAAYPGVLSVGATDTQGGGFCSFSNRGGGLRLLAPGCDLDGADPGSGAANFNYWQGTSESSAIAASSLDALESYRPDLSPAAAEEMLASADNGVLNVAGAFRNAGLGAIISAGEAAEPGAAPATSQEKSPESVPPSNAMTLTRPFARPVARFKRIRGRLVLVLTGRPSEAHAEVRYLGRRRHSLHLKVLRTVQGVFSQLTMPSSGIVEVSLRYVDAYDVGRAGPWITLKVPTPSKPIKRRSGR